jgi:hypothetical protein
MILQGTGDFSDGSCTLPASSSLPKQLRDELMALFPLEGEELASRLSTSFDFHSKPYQTM